MSDVKAVQSSDGWRWIVLPAAFLNMVLCVSINYNCGVLNNALTVTFHAGVVETSWLMSYYCAMFAIVSPLASAAIMLTNCRTCVILSGLFGLIGFASSSLATSLPVLYFTLGLTAIASSLGQSGGVLTLSYYFPSSLALVHGVCLAGTGTGAFIHPVMTQAFIDAYGFYGTMLMLGGLAFHATFFGMLFRPNALEEKSKAFLTKQEHSTWQIVRSKVLPPAAIFRIPAFVVLIPTIFLFSVTFQGMVVILPSYYKRYVGLSIQEGSVAAMFLGAGSVASRLFSGVAASDENIGETVLFVGMSGLLSLLSFCGKFIIAFHKGAFVFSFFFGFYSGGLLSLASTIMMEVVGMEFSAHAYGVIMATYGIAGFTGPPVLSLLVETQGPDMLFIMCGIIGMMVSALALWTTYLRSGKLTTTMMKDMAASARDITIDVFNDDDGDDIEAKHSLLKTGSGSNGAGDGVVVRGSSSTVGDSTGGSDDGDDIVGSSGGCNGTGGSSGSGSVGVGDGGSSSGGGAAMNGDVNADMTDTILSPSDGGSGGVADGSSGGGALMNGDVNADTITIDTCATSPSDGVKKIHHHHNDDTGEDLCLLEGNSEKDRIHRRV